MPNKHAAIKDLRKNQRRGARNARLRTHVKALTRKASDTLKETPSGAREAVTKLQQIAAKAGKRNVIHRNKARRLVSRAHRKLAKASVK